MIPLIANACSLLVAWLAGSGRRSAWVLGILSQGLWLIYALAERQYGFLPTIPIWVAVFARNLWIADKCENE